MIKRGKERTMNQKKVKKHMPELAKKVLLVALRVEANTASSTWGFQPKSPKELAEFKNKC